MFIHTSYDVCNEDTYVTDCDCENMVIKPGRGMPGFLKFLVHKYAHACVYVCVCLPLRLPVTSGMIWIPVMVKQVLLIRIYVAAVVSMVSWCGLSIDAHGRS